MGKSFETITLGNVLTLQRGFDLPKNDRKPGVIPLVSSGGISDFQSEAKIDPPAVITGRYGTLGKVFYLDQPCFPLNTTLWVKDFKGNNPRFCKYLLETIDYLSCSDKAAVPGVNRNHLEQLEVRKIDISEQRAIAHILGTLDNKIELNHKMNQALEDVAKTLFKSWFVDFDQVRAKAGGKPTGLSDEISELFPAEFVESEGSLIPQGWNLGSFGDVIEPKKGKVITKSIVEEGLVPVVAGGISPAYFHSKFNAESPVVTISASGTAGYVNIYYENIWASDCSYINKDITDYVYFSYLFLRHNQEIIYHKRHGAVQQHIYPKDLMELPLTSPSKNLLSAFEKLVTPFFEKISLNYSENKLLESLRSELLPRLISGEFQITDAEKFLEEAST
jgi:type I restriction enzyme S subunit